MATRIHVVDTLEQTQPLPPGCGHPALSLPLCLRACQGHGAVSYYKRSSPSLLQETQTCRSCAPPHPPSPHPLHCFNYSLPPPALLCLCARTHVHAGPAERVNPACVCALPRSASGAAVFTLRSGQSGAFRHPSGVMGKGLPLPFKIKMKQRFLRAFAKAVFFLTGNTDVTASLLAAAAEQKPCLFR